MSREHARILTAIWRDDDFRALSPEAQRLYFLLLSQPTINQAGVLPLTVSRWARGCSATDVADIEAALAELDRARFALVDADTDEVLVRAFMRKDGVAKQPNVLKAAFRFALAVESPRLRAVLADELRRLDHVHADAVADTLDGTSTYHQTEPTSSRSNSSAPTADERPSEGFAEPFPEGFPSNAGVGGKGSSHPDSLPTQEKRHARTRTRGAGVTAATLAATAVRPEAYRLTAGWHSSVGAPYPTKTVRALGKHVDGLLADRADPDTVTAALDLWHGRPGAAPGLLPHLYADAVRARHVEATAVPAGLSKRDAKAAGWFALAAEFEHEGQDDGPVVDGELLMLDGARR
ncbi:hypothetical protein [Lentzea aerocolonigenes]|uniref:hypothetical protein n=1 Tax=Lentzea aerocolonigenes TaxID=68170 RepID=UPI000695B17D|nr:hypothetical protein [Lentzea aerocolonigenes]